MKTLRIIGMVPLVLISATSFGQGYLFGEVPPSSLSGYVYVDTNNDSFKGGSESGIAGVTVTLSGSTALGNPIQMVVQTDGSGSFKFDYVADGTYALLETQPDFVDGQDRAGNGAGGVALDDQIINIVFNSSVDATDYLFGERGSGIAGRVREIGRG